MECSSPRRKPSGKKAAAPTCGSAARRAITLAGSTRHTRGRWNCAVPMARALPPRSAPPMPKTSASCSHRSSSSSTAIPTIAYRKSRSSINKSCRGADRSSRALCGRRRARRAGIRDVRDRARAARRHAGDDRGARVAVARRRVAMALRAVTLGPRAMRRAQRPLQRALWPVLAVLVLLGLAAALWLRPPPKVEVSAAVLDDAQASRFPSPHSRSEWRGGVRGGGLSDDGGQTTEDKNCANAALAIRPLSSVICHLFPPSPGASAPAGSPPSLTALTRPPPPRIAREARRSGKRCCKISSPAEGRRLGGGKDECRLPRRSVEPPEG